jgi:hypothetical protein
MDTGISINAASGKDATGIAEAIVSILNASHDRETAVAALHAFQGATSINNTTISGATVTSHDHWDLNDDDLEDE